MYGLETALVKTKQYLLRIAHVQLNQQSPDLTDIVRPTEPMLPLALEQKIVKA